jgi:hypothetical protein
MFSAFHYATVAQQLIDDAFPPGSGTNGYVLTADDSEPSGVKWAPQSMGSFLPLAGGTMTGNIALGADDLTIGPSNPAHTAKLIDGYGDSIMEWSGGTSAYFPAGIIADNGTANPSITSMTGFGLGFDDPPVIWRSLTGSGVRFRTGQFYVTGYKVFELHETGALVLPSSTVTGSEPNGSIYQSSTTLLYRDQSGVAHDLLAGGGATNLTYNAATRVIASDTGTDATLPLVTSSDAGLAPASGGGTTNFLRADGTWAAPPGGGGAVATDTIWDAKGDLAVGTGADTASKLSVGTNGHVLTADSTTATGLKWAAAAAAAGGSDTQVQYNASGALAGSSRWTFNATTGAMTLEGSITATDGAGTASLSFAAGAAYFGPTSSHDLYLRTDGVSRVRLTNAGVLYLAAPTSGTTDHQVEHTNGGSQVIGYRDIPQNSRSAAYTLTLADAGKHILHPGTDTTARTFTIPANASVAFPVGTAITFVNQNSAGVVTIAITSDTMRLAGAGTTGSRTLAANGIATALKITATEWIISGTGLT